MTTALPAPPKLLPNLAGWMDGKPAPAKWLDWGSRKAMLEALPRRVMGVVLCEYATSVLPVWVAHDSRDKIPHRTIAARLRWCLEPSDRRETRAAEATGAARAAGAAQWRWVYAVYRAAIPPTSWQADWHTSTVVALARKIWRRREWWSLPILADALQDAGCDHEPTLKRLRGKRGPFTRADCALTLPMGMVS